MCSVYICVGIYIYNVIYVVLSYDVVCLVLFLCANCRLGENQRETGPLCYIYTNYKGKKNDNSKFLKPININLWTRYSRQVTSFPGHRDMHGWWKVGTFSFSLLGPIFFFFLLIFWEIQWHPFDNYSIRKMTKPPLVLSKIIIVIRIYFSTNFRHWHSVNMHAAVKSDTDKSLNLNNQEKIVINKENLCIFKWNNIQRWFMAIFLLDYQMESSQPLLACIS